MSLTIIIIILVICMAVGPIFMMQPSRRQRQLAQYRALAAKHGVRVRMGEVGDKTLAIYSLPWPPHKNKKFKGPSLQLIKKDYEHGLHINGLWAVEPSSLEHSLKHHLSVFIQELPASVPALSMAADGVSIYWAESGGEDGFKNILALLEKAKSEFWPLLSREKTSGEQG